MNATAEVQEQYTCDEFLKFTFGMPESERFELIDGYIYAMAPSPGVAHQRFAGTLFKMLSDFFNGKPCEAFIAPLDVHLYDEDGECENVFQPDVFVVCDKDKIKDDGCHGAPDFVIEIASPSSSDRDYVYKLFNYMRFGVREYWIVNPKTEQVSVYRKDEKELDMRSYAFGESIKSGLWSDLSITINT